MIGLNLVMLGVGQWQPKWWTARIVLVGLASTCLLTMFASKVAEVAFDLRARRRAKNQCCANCGFDLRHSPGRCPECGLARGDDPLGKNFDPLDRTTWDEKMTASVAAAEAEVEAEDERDEERLIVAATGRRPPEPPPRG